MPELKTHWGLLAAGFGSLAPTWLVGAWWMAGWATGALWVIAVMVVLGRQERAS